MKGLDIEPCRIEDRRMPTSMHKPSMLAEMCCEDCGERFLIVLTTADSTDITEVCRPCMDKRPTLTVWRCGMARDIKLSPREDLPGFINSLADRGYEYAAITDAAGNTTTYVVDPNSKQLVRQRGLL